MPIPTSRTDLVTSIETEFRKLSDAIEAAGPECAHTVCIDDWTLNDLLAVRVWWSRHVIDWVIAGLNGDQPVVPAPGYKWNETPRLNADVIAENRGMTFDQLVEQLRVAYRRVLDMIEQLDDGQLMGAGTFAWAGKWPVARWISIGTTRQYTSARTAIRRMVRNRQAAQ